MRILLAAILALLPPAMAADKSFYVSWSSSADERANSVARGVGNLAATSLGKQYPCARTTTAGDVEALMDLRRKQELLGTELDPQMLANIGGAIGASTSVHFRVTMNGDTVVLTAMTVDNKAAKAVQRDSMTAPYDKNLLDKMEAFAKRYVSSMAMQVPLCPGKDWTGTVSVTYDISVTGNDGGSDTGSGSMQCSLPGDGSLATCSYTGSSVMKSKRGSVSFSKTAKETRVAVGVGVANGKLGITFGTMRVETTMTTAEFGAIRSEEDFAPQSISVPASGSPTSQSGSYNEPMPVKGMKITYSWNLSRKPEKK